MASVKERTTGAGKTSWAVLYRHGRKQTSKTFATARGAERFKTLVDQFGPDRALQLLAEQASPNARGITLDELAEKWLAHKDGKVTPNILRGYHRDYENWISPHLGHREAALITEVDVQGWVDKMTSDLVSPATKKPLSAKSIADRHAILHQIYKWGSARTRNLVPYNPCKETELPRRTKTPPKGLRLPELYRLLEAGEKTDQDTADVIAFMAGTAWRISETIALQADAVEDDGVSVYVNMERVNRRAVGITEGGKSDAALRRLRILGPGVAAVRRRMVGLGPTDLVFTFADGRPGVDLRKPWNFNSFRDRRWPRVVKAAGLEQRGPTPHWLRHTHVAVCVKAGLTLPEIQRRLGHEDIQTTINIYGRMIDEMSDEAASRLDQLLTAPPAREAIVAGQVVQGAVEARSST